MSRYLPNRAIRATTASTASVEACQTLGRRLDRVTAGLQDRLDIDREMARSLTAINETPGVLEYLDADQLRHLKRSLAALREACNLQIDRLRDITRLTAEVEHNRIGRLQRARG